jgi:hypothetical protein
MCSILTWSTSNDWEIDQIDMQSAYLYGNLNKDEEIYIYPSLGNLLLNLKDGQVFKLKKVLYRLKQAGCQWYTTLLEILNSLHLTKSKFNNTVFHRWYQDKIILILFIHVDDITLCRINKHTIITFETALEKYIAFTNDGEIHWLLGIEI